MIATLRAQVEFGLITEKVLVLGKKNAEYISTLNKKAKIFGEIIPIEHPRYIQQYHSKDADFFREKYLSVLSDLEKF